MRTLYPHHNWEKINLVTIKMGWQVYDTYKCLRCGAEGKRFGLSPHVTPNKRYAGKPCKVKVR